MASKIATFLFQQLEIFQLFDFVQFNMNSLLSYQSTQFLQPSSECLIHIGNYTYGQSSILGHGSSSVVYKGKNDSSNQIVAIKVIELKRLKTTIQKILLENEKKVIQQLIRSDLKGVSKYIQIIKTKTHLYLVMQYEAGGDLEQLINEGRLQKNSVTKYLLQILTSYIGLSQNKIIHRDLKPANLLLDENGDLKIADFGFAVIQSQQAKIYNYSLGSPVYCSPQSLQLHQYGIKSDIWAIGVITYKMLTGKIPWKARNNEELIKRMKEVPINSLLEGIKEELQIFLSGCFAVDTNERFGINQLKDFKKKLQNIEWKQKMSLKMIEFYFEQKVSENKKITSIQENKQSIKGASFTFLVND